MSKKDGGWWDGFFTDFRPVFGIISPQVSHAQARYIAKKLGLRRGKTFLDCPCGIGRISLPLAGMGIRVTGVDITQSYLDELAAKAKRRKLKIDLVRRDMRRINYRSQFDAAANLWTSFGYFEDESENLLVLKKMYRALKPGGKFMLHLVNRDYIMVRFQPRGWFEVPAPRGRATIKVVENRHFDFRTSINRCVWYFIQDGREKSFELNLRMYSFHELVAMFKAVGFADVEGYSSVKDDPINLERMMMFVIGTRPKRR